MPSGTRPPRTAPGTARSEHRPGRRLLLAFTALALLPLAAGLLGAAARGGASEPLASVAASNAAFGRHYRGYREHHDALMSLLAAADRLPDRAARQRLRTAAGVALDGMRRHVDGLAATGLLDTGSSLASAWRDVERLAGHVLTAGERRLEAGEAAGGADDAISAAGERTAPREREAARRASVDSAAERLLDRLDAIDEANDEQFAELLLAAGRSLTRSDRLLLGLGGLGTLVALVALFALVERGLRRRLHRLVTSARRLAGGELTEAVPVDGDDELAELAEALEGYRRCALSLSRHESLLQQRGRALVSVQRDLDEFARVAAQDLRAPLRAIDSLAGFLREDLGASLCGDSLRHLDLLQARVRRIETRLDSLLEYARAGRGTLPCEVVDLRELVEHCIDLVSPPGAQAVLNGGFGRVSTRRAPLEQIVCNLLDNAFRHNDEAHGLVSVDCDLRDRDLQIVVADCGPGIAPESHKRIFGLFRTLAPGDDVEGAGMGLAVLQKLIDRYGGSIEVDSDPARGRGAAFIVRWPVSAVLSATTDTGSGRDILEAVAGAA